MTRPDPALGLSTVETESLRRLRTRLDKPAAGEAAKAVLGKVFLETVARAGLEAQATAGVIAPSPAALIATAEAADIAGLRALCAILAHARTTDPRAFAKLLDARVPQAIISRRLALAGREAPKIGAGD